MPVNIVIVGAGGNCIDIIDAIYDINKASNPKKYRCIGLLDDNKSIWGSKIHGVEVLGPIESASDISNCKFVNGIGNTNNFYFKDDIISKTNLDSEIFESIIHPGASLSTTAEIGKGVVVLSNSTVCSNAVIQDHAFILPNCVISHDSLIGEYTSVASGACISGGVEIGNLSYLGSNCSVQENTKIGHQSLVGMGSVVIGDVPDQTVVAGNPARYLRNSY